MIPASAVWIEDMLVIVESVARTHREHRGAGLPDVRGPRIESIRKSNNERGREVPRRQA